MILTWTTPRFVPHVFSPHLTSGPKIHRFRCGLGFCPWLTVAVLPQPRTQCDPSLAATLSRCSFFLHHTRTSADRWGLEQVDWASSVDDEEEGEASEDFTGNNPMYARPVETVEEKNIQTRARPAPSKRSFPFAPRKTRGPSNFSPSRFKRGDKTGGPSSHSPSRSVVRNNDEGHAYDSNLSATYARSTRRPVRAFQKLDDELYDGFLNAAKKKPKASRGFRRMRTMG